MVKTYTFVVSKETAEKIATREERLQQEKLSQIKKSGGGWVTGSLEQYPSGKSVVTEKYAGGTITTVYSPQQTGTTQQKQMFEPSSKTPTVQELPSKTQTSVSPISFTDTIKPSDRGTVVNVAETEKQRQAIQRAYQQTISPTTRIEQKKQIKTSVLGTKEVKDKESLFGKIGTKYIEQTGMTTTIPTYQTQIPKSISELQTYDMQSALSNIYAPEREYTYGVKGKKGIVVTQKPLQDEKFYLISSKGVYPKEASGQAISSKREQTEQVVDIINQSMTKKAYVGAEQKLAEGIISFDVRDYNLPIEVKLASLVETTKGIERVGYGASFGAIKIGQQTGTKFTNIVAEVVSPIGLGTLAVGGVATKIAPSLMTLGYTGLTVGMVTKEAQKSFVDMQSQDKLISQKIESAVQPISTGLAYYGFAKTYQATVEYFPLRYTILELPKKGGKKIVDETTGLQKPETEVIWRGLSFEIRGTGFGKQLIGVSKGKLVVGEGYLKNVNLGDYEIGELISSDIYFPEGSSASARRKLLPEYGKTMQDLDVYFRSKSQFAKSPYTRSEFIKETKSLSREQINEVLSYAKDYGGKIEGSFVQRGHLKQGRVAGDIDIHFNELDTTVVEGITKNLVKDLNLLASQGKGNPVRISQERTTLIEANVGGKWIHATDIFSFEQGTLGSYSLGYKMEKGSQMIEGIQAQKIGEQALRKGNSIFQFKEESGKIVFEPEQHRVKDIGDFFTIQKTLFEKQPKTLERLETLKTSYEAQLPSSIKGEIAKQSTTIEIPVNLYSPSRTFVSNAGQFASSFSAIASGSGSKEISSMAISKSYTPKDISMSSSISKSQSMTPSKSYSSSSMSKSVSASISMSSSLSKSTSVSRSMSSSLSKSMSGSISSSSSTSSSTSASSSVSASMSSSMSQSSSSASMSSSSASRSSSKGIGYPLNFNIPTFERKKKGKKFTKGFNVFVRKKGKFVQVSQSALPEIEAKGKLFKVLKETARASGFIRPSNQMVEEKPQMFGAFGNMKQKNIFYTKKEKGQKIYVQRTQFRISSMGEKREISYKGLAIQQNKKAFGGLFK